MRWYLVVFAVLAHPFDLASGEIRDVLKSSEIDAIFARTQESSVVHKGPTYTLTFKVQQKKPGPYQMYKNADEIWFVRSGKALLLMSDELVDAEPSAPGEFGGSGLKAPRRHEVGAGDIVNLPRGTAYQSDPGSGRFEYVAVRIFPTGAHPTRRFRGPSPMPEVVKSSERDATFANHDSNQPLHSARNVTVNYVIYKGHAGPWEAHRGCVDIYFMHTGTGMARLGGEITDPKEEVPGEIRGSGVKGARKSEIGPGDIVLIPHQTAHYMVPTSEKLGYNLVKVWAQ